MKQPIRRNDVIMAILTPPIWCGCMLLLGVIYLISRALIVYDWGRAILDRRGSLHPAQIEQR